MKILTWLVKMYGRVLSMNITLWNCWSQAGSGINAQAGPEPYKFQYWYAKKPSGSERSAESASFISEFYVLHKNPTQPVRGTTDCGPSAPNRPCGLRTFVWPSSTGIQYSNLPAGTAWTD